MSIIYTNETGTGLFDLLGKIGGFLFRLNQYQGELRNSKTMGFVDKFTNFNPRRNDLVTGFTTAVDTHITSSSGFGLPLEQVALSLLTVFVSEHNPYLTEITTLNLLKELISTMEKDAQHVKRYTISFNTPVISDVPRQDLVLNTNTLDGSPNQQIRTETLRLLCVADSYDDITEPGNETYSVVGQTNTADRFSYKWPPGSGNTALLGVTDTTESNNSGNLVSNPTMTNTDEWEIPTTTYGTTGVHFQDGGRILGNNAVVIVRQDVSASLNQRQGVGFYFKIKLMETPETPTDGNISFSLCYADLIPVTDNSNNSLSLSVNINTLTTNPTVFKGIWFTPTLLEETIFLQIRLDNVLPGKGVIIESASLCASTEIYPMGPHLALFGNKTYPEKTGHHFDITFANTKDMVLYNMTFQALFDRLFNMRFLGLQLPSSDNPSISEGLLQ